MKKYVFLSTLFCIVFLTVIPIISVQAEKIEDLFAKSKIAYYQGDLQESNKYLNYILDIDEKNEKAIRNLIIINKELGNNENVLDYYRRLLSIDYTNAEYKYNYALFLYKRGNINRSKEILLELIKEQKLTKLKDYQYSLLYYYLGKIFYKNGNYKVALEHYERGSDYYSENVLNYLGKAEIYREQEKYSNAVIEYLHALKKDSSLSYLYPEIASCYEKVNNYESAYIYWKKSITSGINPGQAQVRIDKILAECPELDKDEERQIITDVEWLEAETIADFVNIPQLNIGLLDNISEFMFRSRTDFEIIHNNNIILSGSDNDLWYIKYADNTFSFYKNDELIKNITGGELILNTEQFVIINIPYGQGYFWSDSENRQYRGKIKLAVNNSNTFTLINQINLEEYLFSVVPSEMPSWWPEEALKAQSTAARTYALKNSKLNRHKLYDLCDEVHCEVYGGLKSENERAKSAVLSTAGEVITHDGNLINAVFSSNSGGYSENSEDIWGTEVEYLRGKNNFEDGDIIFPLTPYELNNWIKKQEKSKYYSHFSGNNTYRWIREIPINYIKDKYNLSILKDIMVNKRSIGGSVTELTLKGLNREIKVEKDAIRGSLGGLKSNRFLIEKDYDKDHNLEQVILYGSGWGHSVGMDQTAAAGMAEHGFNYQEILKHFYNDTEIEKIY